LETIKEYPKYLESFIHPKVPFPGDPKWGITKILSTDDLVGRPQTVVSLEILTGRTHQIRYQLSELGLPVVGDYLYNAKSSDEHMQLTAWKLEFIDIENEIIIINI
jgi:23S rRNA-/tRNA-specific pseudouridylate synthase